MPVLKTEMCIYCLLQNALSTDCISQCYFSLNFILNPICPSHIYILQIAFKPSPLLLQVYATATEDMDALTFHSDKLLRHMTFSEARKMPIQEFSYQQVLNEMELSHDSFVDLCILLGCDYCEHIRGIGPKRAYELIQKYKSIDEILKHIDQKKYTVPEGWVYKEARRLFLEPEVSDAKDVELKWRDPDEEGIVKFMVEEKGFNEERIRNGVKKIIKSRQKSTQGRLDDFFKVLPSTPSNKRKSNDKGKLGSAKKKAKTTGGKFKKR